MCDGVRDGCRDVDGAGSRASRTVQGGGDNAADGIEDVGVARGGSGRQQQQWWWCWWSRQPQSERLEKEGGADGDGVVGEETDLGDKAQTGAAL